jgi:hypothetical protein
VKDRTQVMVRMEKQRSAMPIPAVDVALGVD